MPGAPNCRACNRPTWNPSGYCHDHENLAGVPGSGSSYGQDHNRFRPSQGPDRSDTPQGVVESFSRVFDEVDIVTPYSMGMAADQVVRGAVSVEAMRAFPRTDVSSVEHRRSLLDHEEQQLMEHTRLYSTDVNSDSAVGYLNSSADHMGIGYDEAMVAATFAIKKEHELGRLQGLDKNRLGIPYNIPLDDFLGRHRHHMQQVARTEFNQNAARYGQIIQQVSGRSPMNSAPVMDELSARRTATATMVEERPVSELSDYEVGDSILKVASFLGGKVKGAAANQVHLFKTADRAVKSGVARAQQSQEAHLDREFKKEYLRRGRRRMW